MREFDLEKYKQQFGILESEVNKPATKESSPEKTKAEVLYFLSKNGVVKEINGKNVVDVARLKQGQLPYASSNRDKDSGKKITAWNTLKVLSEIKGLEKQAQEVSGEGEEKEKPVMVFPKSLKEMQNGEYAVKANKALMQPWELGQVFKYWQKEIKLESGEITNCSELALVKALADFKARRNEQGDLEIFDPEKGQYVKFSGNAFHRLTGMQFGGARDNIYIHPVKFAREHLKNLLALGVLKDEDFGSLGDEIFPGHERKNIPSERPYISFSNSRGESAKYYLGKGTLAGLNISIRKGVTSARKLAPDLVGIIEKDGLKQRIVATLDLDVSENITNIRNQAAANLEERAGKIDFSNVSANAVLKEDYAKKHLKKYNITDYLPPRSGESPEEYFKRIEPLNNEEFVFKTMQRFYSDAGVGTHNLPWSEQLVLARSLLEGMDEKRLANFAKTYGLVGVRTFLSLDYDNKLGNKIIRLSETLEKGVAEAVFKKYSEIVDAANKAGAYLTENFSEAEHFSNMSVRKIQEQLMRRGKDLLSGLSDRVALKKNGNLESVEIIRELENIQADILLFTNMCRVLKQEQGAIDFSNLKDITCQCQTGSDLKAKTADVEQIQTSMQRNYQKYPADFRRVIVNGFSQALDNPDTSFFVLRRENKPLASCRFDEVKNGKGEPDYLYFGSFNSDASYAGGRLGEAMLEQALRQELSKGLPIEADCDPHAPISQKYLEMGFVAEQLIDYKGVPSFHIRLNPETNKNLLSKEWSREEIIKKVERTTEVMDQNIIIQKLPTGQALSFAQLNFRTLTRYFQEQGFIYLVYEKMPQALSKVA